jgi:urease beta subunit
MDAPDGTLKLRALSTNTATGRGIAGSGGVVSGAASVVTTADNASTKATLGGGTAGSPVRVDDLRLRARHNATYKADVTSVQASVIGASGAHAEHSVAPTVRAKVSDDSAIRAEDLDVAARSKITNPRAEGYDLTSGSGGVVDAAAVRAESVLQPDTKATIGDGSTLDVSSPNGRNEETGDLEVLARNDFDVDQRVRLDSGGAIAVARGVSVVDIASGARVDVGDADLDSVGDLNLVARTQMADGVDARANVKTYGGAGAAKGKSEIDAHTVNKVDVSGGAELKALKDVRLLAGRNVAEGIDLVGERSVFDLTARTDLWNKTAFPIETDPVANAYLNQTNTVTVGGGADVKSVGDIELAAAEGRRVLTGKGKGTDLYRKALEEAGEDIAKLFGEDAELSLDINGGDTADESENVVRVEGRLEAGVHSNETLIIDGSLDAATQTNGIDFSIDERNIATNLEARIDELQEQLANTEGDEVADAALEAEIRLLQRRLQELGGGEDSDGDPVPVKNLTAPFIVVEDVRAGPGAIDITGDALVGSGEMRASGDASVRIENQGPAYLDVNDVTIPAKGGGQVTFNRAPVSGADEINDLNPDDRKGADFVSIETAESSPDPSIDIRSTFDPDTFDPDSPDDVDNENPQLDLQPSINIVGNVRNLNGDVSVVNDSGNVNISGKLRAQEVNIESGGSVLVSFAEGFRHIGGDPRVNGFGGSTIAANEVIISGRYLNLNGIIQSGIPAWNVDLGSADRQEIAGFRARWARGATEDDRLILRERDNAAGRPKVFYDASEDRIEIASVEVAGGFMELTGKIMNTGGTPEALNFSTENVSGSVFGLGTLDSAYENDETVEIESFGVGSAETTLKYDGRDDRVFFDGAPVENYADVGGTGGTFLLANGRRLSLEVGDKPSQVGRNTKFDTSSSVTDAGYVEARAALRVVDGYGRIDIDNDTGTALRANALDAGNDIAGTLRINDTDALDGKGSVDTTVYERVGDDVRVYNEDDDGTRTLLRTNADSRSAEYTPESGLKFGWSEAKGTIKRRTTIETADVAIGIFPSGSDFEQKDRQTDSFSEFIGGSEYVTTDDVSSETIEVEDTGYKQISEENWWKCVRSTPGVCWEVRYFRRTVEEKGTKEVERNIVAADHPIDVQFIGRDDPGIFVDNANAALEIAGNVNAPTGTVELTGDQIEGVSDGATVRAQDVVLDAETGIEALDVTAGNALRATTDRGPVEITSREALPVDYVASDAGDVTIRALQGGGIESAAAGTNVRGDDVTLSAETGSVGASGAPIGIDSSATADGVVNVTAGQDVFMRENNGDLRVERIAALGGDLDVAVDDGAVIDLNTTATRDKRREAELVRVWNEMALLNEGESRAAIDRRIEQEVEAYERRQERAYERYWREVRNLRERDDGELVADDFDPDTFDYELPAEERRDLLDDGADDKAIAELEAKRERDLIRMHKDILDEPADAAAYNPKFDYEASDSEETRLSEGASWTRKQLTNTIAAGLVTGETETSDPDIEEENFLAGGSVTIDAERIGAQTIGDVVIDTSGDDVSLTDEQRIALATAEPYDIKGIQDGDGRLRVVQREDANVVAGDGITARAGSDIFIGGEQPLELREIDGGAVRIKNADDTTTARPDKVVVDGTRVILEAGKGKLGRPDAPIRMDAQDRVTARGGDGVFVTQTGDLALQRVVSGGDVRIDVGNGGSLTPKTEGGIDILAQQGAVSLDVDGQVAGRYRRLNVAADSARVASGGDVWLGAEQFNGAVLDLALDDSTVGGTLRVDSVTGLDILGAVETGSMRASADGAIAAVSDDAVLINKDGLMHLEAGTAIGAPASPLRVEPDRLRASAQDGGIQLTNTGGITFDERSSAADADGIAWFNIADGGKVTAADLVGDRLTVDVDTLSGPRLEAREGAMNLTVGGSTNIDKVLGGASVHIDAGSIEIGEAVADARFTASTAARRGLLGAQDFTEVTADGPIDLASEGIVTAKRLISLNARIDVDGKAATITDRGAADTALSVATTGFQDHRELEAGGAMTLDAGGPLEWAVASGGAGLDADADGKIAVGGPTDPDIEPGETTFAGTIDIAGGADIDLDDTVESTGADIGLRAGNALTAEDLRAAGAVTVTDTGRAAIEQGEAGATLIVRTDGAQDHRELRAGGLMTLDAGGTLEWAIAAGNAELDTDAGAEIAAGGSTDGEVAKGETTFAGTVDIAGGADVDLDDTVDSTGADIAISAGNALTAEYLVADQAIAVTDTGRAAIELGKAGTTFDVATRDAQDHRELHAGSAMTLDAGGPLEWAIATGNATLDADAAGDIAAGGFTDPNVGSGTTSFAGRGDIVGAADIDLNDRVESTGGDIALSAEDALSAEELIADQAITVFNTGSAAIELGEAGATFDVVTRGFQNHGTLTAGDAMGFEAGIDHDGFENDAAGGSDFAALELTSETGDIHVDAGSAAVEFATANADDRAIRVHTTGIQSHGQLLGYDGVLEADGEVQLTAGDTVRFRDIKAGKDTDVPANGGDARIVSLDGDILGNRIDASRDIILRALKGNLEIERLDYGGSYTLEAGRDIIAGIGGDFDTRDGEINAGRNIDIETLGTTDEPGDILVGGIETEDGFVQLDAARDVRIAVDRSGNEPTSGRLDAGTSVEIIAGRDVLVDRQMTAGKNIDIDASRDVALFTVDSGGDQTIDAGGGLTFGALDAGGAIAIDSGGSTVGLGAGRAEAVAAKGPVHMDAGVDIRLDAATVAGTDVDIDAVRDIALFIVGSGGDQTLDAGGDLAFDRVDAGGSVITRSAKATYGRSGDQADSVIADEQVDMVAGLADGTFDGESDLAVVEVAGQTVRLSAADVLDVDTVRADEAADLEGRAYDTYVTHTGPGSLDLDATGPANTLARMFALEVDARGGIDSERVYTVAGEIDTNADRAFIEDAWIDSQLDLRTASAYTLINNRATAARPADFQLHDQLDRRSMLEVDGKDLFTDAFVVRFGFGFQNEVPNFAGDREYTGIDMVGQSGARNGMRRRDIDRDALAPFRLIELTQRGAGQVVAVPESDAVVNQSFQNDETQDEQ